MAEAVTPTNETPRHYVSLADSSVTLGFMLTDARGEENVNSLKRIPLQSTALKTSQGDSKYSDLEPPYFAIAQDDWSGGRGMLRFEDDKSRFQDSEGVDT